MALQEQNARAFADGKGWELDDRHVFVDDGESGADVKRLVGRQQMLALAYSHPRPFDVIVMQDVSRFSRRDGDESFAELKALDRAGIQVWFYTTGQPFRHGTLEANLTGFISSEIAAEHRRVSAAKTTEAMRRKFDRGHHVGGRVYGYDLVDVMKDGRRVRRASGRRRDPDASHVELEINEAERPIVRRIFELVTQGLGLKRIAQLLNAEGVSCPRPQQHRPAGSAPSSLHALLRSPLYRGEVVWNRTKKRNASGEKASQPRPESEWRRVSATHLQIVPEELWQQAHAAMAAQRARYRDRYGAAAWGREVKYLLAGRLTCASCGATLEARSGRQGGRRVTHYGCSAYHRKGRSVCPNSLRVRTEIADAAVIDSLSATLFDPRVLDEGVRRAAAELTSCRAAADDQSAADELQNVDVELRRVGEQMAGAVATDALPVLVDQVSRLGDRRRALIAERAHGATLRRNPASIGTDLTATLRARLRDAKGVLVDNPAEARQLITRLIVGRLLMTPHPEEGFYRFTGEGTVEPLLSGILPQSLASPPGFEPGFQP